MRRRALAASALLFGGLAIPALSSTSGLASLGASPVPHDSPHWADGRFHNEEPTGVMKEGSASVLGEFLWSDTLRSPTCPLPLVKPTLSPAPATGLRITWLGHSSTLIELDGVTVLTDPQWSQRASPSTLVGPHRFHPPPLPFAELPRVDAVLISHDHYDHLDMETVQALGARGVAFHVGLGVGRHLEGWGIPRAQVTEHDWWSSSELPGGVTVVSTPARHFSGRRGVGNDGTLWTSWALVGPRHRVYFSGDTGQQQTFSTVARRYGPFDVAMLEIGQWHPSWGDIHLGPKGALLAFARLDARRLLPIHWATFELGLHAWNEPPETLYVEAATRGAALLTPRLGESVEPEVAVTGPWWRALPPLAAACP